MGNEFKNGYRDYYDHTKQERKEFYEQEIEFVFDIEKHLKNNNENI